MIRRNFFLSMLSGPEGISSKRSVMVFFVVLFSFCVVWNLFTGMAPASIYQEQVFELVIITISLVFGEKVIDALPKIRGAKKDTTTTIVAPPDSTVAVTGNQPAEVK
jgi:hypothetical protein